MRHISVPVSGMEIIDITPYNPLVSKVSIKVCYVGEEPNRNKSIITKETAQELANSLPGSPIVGYFNPQINDFEEHTKRLTISNGEITVESLTKPYGFVDLGAKVWFQWFEDDGVQHEYLCTEGWLWTGQYPECQKVVDEGSNQSMELDEENLNASWTRDNNGKPQFFIINEAIISKLCILGDACEPCFEGAQITKVQFSLSEDFKEQISTITSEIKRIMEEGGTPNMNVAMFAVEIGDALWNALYDYINHTYPSEIDKYISRYSIDGIYEENGTQKFVILRDRATMKYYRLNFSVAEDTGLVVGEELQEVTQTYTPAETPQFNEEQVEAYIAQYKTEHEETPKQEKSEEQANKVQYNLNEIPEYIELQSQYAELVEQNTNLQNQIDQLTNDYNSAKETIVGLTNYKMAIEREQKQKMIDKFYMLSDEDKQDCVTNIDTYSLDDIEAKLSVICVRNKVSFADEEDENSANGPTTFNLFNENGLGDAPAWVQAAIETSRAMNN